MEDKKREAEYCKNRKGLINERQGFSDDKKFFYFEGRKVSIIKECTPYEDIYFEGKKVNAAYTKEEAMRHRLQIITGKV